MKRFQIAMLATAWTCLSIGAMGQPAPAPASSKPALTEAELRAIFNEATKQANAFYKSEGFPLLAPSPDLTTLKFTLNSEYNEQTGVFDPTGPEQLSCEILASSGKFVNFYNYAAEHAYQRAPMSVIPPPAKWSKEHAIDLASSFANIFVKAWGVILGHPQARYIYPGHDMDQKTGKLLTPPGQWQVTLLEQTPSGIVYRKGGVCVYLSEMYGPHTIFINFPAQYEDEHITPISQDRALIEARKGLDKILGSSSTKTSLGQVQVLDKEPPFAALMIVQPNNMTQQPDTYAARITSELRARLAWVVVYKVNAEDGDGMIDVYIDAKDGSFLGGYF